jgi:hypothetical protein
MLRRREESLPPGIRFPDCEAFKGAEDGVKLFAPSPFCENGGAISLART